MPNKVKAYPPEVRELCKVLYLKGAFLSDISRAFDGHPTREIISSWKKKEKWEQQRDQVIEKANAILHEDLTEIKIRYKGVINAGLSQFLKDIRDGNIQVRAGEAARLIQMGLLVAGEATERVEGVTILDKLQKYHSRKKKEKKKSKS